MSDCREVEVERLRASFGKPAAERPGGALGRDGLGHNNFDYIRLFAATQVVIFHAVNHLQINAPVWTEIFRPFQGVPIFFVVSGFLVTASYERSTSLRSYVEKRARRILPGLWFCLIVTAIILLVLGYPVLTSQGLTWFVAQLGALIYTPAFLRSFGFGSYNGSLWTIPVEIQFYLTVPILSYCVHRVRRRLGFLASVLAFFTVLAIAIRIYIPSVIGVYETPETFAAKVVRYAFFSHYFLFVLGALGFYVSAHRLPWIRGKLLLWLIPVVAIHLFAPWTVFTIILGQLFLGIFVLSAAFTYIGRNLMEGYDISYGVYLFHGLVLNVMIVMGLSGALYQLYVVLGVSYVAGLLSWVFVETAFIRRGPARSAQEIPGGPASLAEHSHGGGGGA